MLTVTLFHDDLDKSKAFVRIWKVAAAIARANGANNLLDAERKIFPRINAAVQQGSLKPLNPENLVPLPKADYGNGIVPLAELVEWGRAGKLFDFKIAASQTTKAPPPITPLRGSGYIPKPSTNDRFPRWNKWRLMPEVKEWEAVALSLNIEPEKIKTDRNAWMGAAHPFDEGDDFNDRLTVLNKQSLNRTHFPTSCILNIANWYNCEVRLDEFAAWCIHVGFEIPPELTALAKTVPQAAPMVEAAPVTPSQVNKLRRDILDPALDKAIKNAENMELADVYLKLKELAKDEEPPFTGLFAGDALCYTDTNDKPAKLTKEALGKRLERRANKAATS